MLTIGGYSAIDQILDVVESYDLARGAWLPPLTLPDDAPHSHHAVATDGTRYAYVVAGQRGPWCSPAVPRAYLLDTWTRTWSTLPPLPAARYAGAMQLWRGRLHYVGGSREDRATPAAEHWSIAVSGREVAGGWRTEVPIPRPGPHRASAVLAGALYVFGGQEGDLAPVPGDPDCRCYPSAAEEHHAEVYRLRPGTSAWERLHDMPVTTSHTEESIVVRGDRAVIVGGSCDFELADARFTLTDVVQQYDARRDQWVILGRLPYRLKNTVVGYWNGWLYAIGGQRDLGPDDPSPGAVVADAWRTRILL